LTTRQLGPIYDPGDWINPAEEALHGLDPSVDAWAREAFADIEHALRDGGSAEVQRQLLVGTLWHALDAVRARSATWPPISFCLSVDDEMPELLARMAARTVRP
jgi:hypothetical protein